MREWLLLMLLCAAGCSPGPADDAVVLVYATPYPPGHPFSLADREWMDFVRERSNGTLRIEPNWSGALLSSEHSMLELRHGVADIGLITPIYVKGGAHLIRVQSGFYSGVESVENQVALYHCLEAASPQFAAELSGLKVLAVQGGSMPGIITTGRPIHRLEELHGLRIRVPTELLGVLKNLGADPINMPMGEVYSALAKGIVDGVVAPADTLLSLHFAEVTRYFADLRIPRGAYPARAMNQDRWSRLSAEHQRALEEGIAVWQAALARQTRQAEEKGRAAARGGGVEIATLPASDQRRFDELYLEFARSNAASLARYGIDGMAVFNEARASINGNGSVTCRGSED